MIDPAFRTNDHTRTHADVPIARSRGRWLLVLDTVKDGDGERVYTRMGWQRTGVIPDYALFPDGSLCDTVVFWKKV